MAYSIDFREKAILYWDNGHTQEELYEVFGIYPSRINAWKRLLKETGSLKTQYRETRKRKIDIVKLKQALEMRPDATLPELAKQFNCTKQAVHTALKKMKITRKKDLYLLRKRRYGCDVLYHVYGFSCYVIKG